MRGIEISKVIYHAEKYHGTYEDLRWLVKAAGARGYDSKNRTMPEPRPCAWCGTPFAPRVTGGLPQRFCSAASRNCRHEIRQAPVAWAEQKLANGNPPNG